MFKNFTVFKVSNFPKVTGHVMLEAKKFVPCGATQPLSGGWIPVYKEGGFADQTNGGLLLAFQIEEKKVPAAHLKRKVEERCNKIEKETGRRPAKAYQANLREDLLLALLPKAFPRQTRIDLFYDYKTSWLFISHTAQSRLNAVITAFVETFKVKVKEVSTKHSPVNLMRDALADDGTDCFSVGNSCKLVTDDPIKPSITYKNFLIDKDEITNLMQQGLDPVELELGWNGEATFKLTSELKIKQLTLGDAALVECLEHEESDKALAYVYTKTISRMFSDLCTELGGEHV